MRMRATVTLLALLVAALLPLAARADGAAPFKVGVTTRRFTPDGSYDWRGAQTKALVATVWYPAVASAAEQPQWFGPPDAADFSAGSAAPDAALAPAPAKFPLIVLSHGTGGAGLTLGWLGTALAARGYVAVAVNHPGNNGAEPYTVPGFILWWERARDLSAVIDRMLAEPQFGKRLDAHRIGAAGFSLGGYTVLELAGAITDRARFAQFCAAQAASASCKAPPEFPDLADKAAALAQSDPAFRAALDEAGRSYRDPRVQAVFAMAPALGPAVTPQSLGAVPVPVEIVAGAGDTIVPPGTSAQYYASRLLNVRLTMFPGGVGHYTFLGQCNAEGEAREKLLCADAPGVDRAAIHEKTIDLAAKFFAANLP